MASTINADNGVVSGSSGVKTTADTSGVLALQSNGSTGVTLNTDLSVTFAGAQTLSAGTANGVTYLNGSKVLTSGSALTFDGTNFVLNNGSIRANNTLGYYTNLTATGLTNFATTMDFDSVGSYLFKIASSEQMRLTSTGLGIGTSSPANPTGGKGFEISNASGASIRATNSATYLDLQSGSSANYILSNGAYPLLFYTNGSERFRIGSAGQLGIGGATYGTSGQVLTSGGSGAAPSWSTPAAGGFSNMEVFTSSTSWTVPTGVSKIKVIITAGGGGAGTYSGSGGGGAGSTLIATVEVTAGWSLSITVGSGGSAYTQGGNSQILYNSPAIYLYAGGGIGSADSRDGGNGGTAANYSSGGPTIVSMLIRGGGGGGGFSDGGVGGSSYWGGGGLSGYNTNGSGLAYGSGGGGRGQNGAGASSGAAGVVVIEY